LPGNNNEVWESIGEGRTINILQGEEEGTAGEGCSCLRDGQMQELRRFDAANNVAVGVVDRHSRLSCGESDRVGRSVVLDDGGEVLELRWFVGPLRVANVGQKWVQDEQGKDDDHDAKKVPAIVMAVGVKELPDAVQHEAASDGKKWSSEDEGKRMDGNVVAHEDIEEEPRKAKAAHDIDGRVVLAAVGLKPKCEEEKSGKKRECIEVLKDPSQDVGAGA